MITDEDAKKLVETLRRIATRNAADRGCHTGEYWKGQSDGRAGAYSLAAEWLEALIVPDDEEADNVSDSSD